MMERNHGHIVSIASIAGFAPCNGMTDYCASKYAAVGFNDALELELHAAGSAVRTTVVCPYFINTGMFDGCQTRYLSTVHCYMHFQVEKLDIRYMSFLISLRFPAILPVLDQEDVTDKIVKAVLINQRLLFVPRTLSISVVLKQ